MGKKKGLTLLLRPTSKLSDHDFNDLKNKFPDSIIDDPSSSLTDSLIKWRPKLVGAWTSTGLATALDYGCIPISLYDPKADMVIWNIIYPMRQRVLFWPRDEEILNKAIQSELSINSQIQALQAETDSLI